MSANFSVIRTAISKQFKRMSEDRLAVLRLEIVKHVIEVRLRDQEAARTALERREKKNQLLGLIEQKKNEQLAGKSVEELLAMVESL